MQLLSLNCSTLPLIRTLYCWVLSKEVSSTILKVFGMTLPGIELRSPGQLANTLPTRPMSRMVVVDPYINSAVNDLKTFRPSAGLSMLDGRLETKKPPSSAGPGHLRVGELHYCYLWRFWIALDVLVQFKLSSGIRAWTHVWVHVHLGSSGSHRTKWADDQHSPAGLEPRLVTDRPTLTPSIIDLRIIDLLSSPVWLEAETNITFRLT